MSKKVGGYLVGGTWYFPRTRTWHPSALLCRPETGGRYVALHLYHNDGFIKILLWLLSDLAAMARSLENKPSHHQCAFLCTLPGSVVLHPCSYAECSRQVHHICNPEAGDMAHHYACGEHTATMVAMFKGVLPLVPPCLRHFTATKLYLPVLLWLQSTCCLECCSARW